MPKLDFSYLYASSYNTDSIYFISFILLVILSITAVTAFIIQFLVWSNDMVFYRIYLLAAIYHLVLLAGFNYKENL